MRFASCLFVAVALMVVASVALSSFHHRGGSGAAAASCARIVSAGNAVVVQRLDAKNTVTHRLLDGQIGLLEAAAWFRAIDKTTGANPLVLPGEEGESEPERCCRQVIRWAEATSRVESAESAEAVVRRLEKDLNERLRSAGGIDLPDGN